MYRVHDEEIIEIHVRLQKGLHTALVAKHGAACAA
jgi:hypothetical protein